jgi:hypothetical protein
MTAAIVVAVLAILSLIWLGRHCASTMDRGSFGI